VAPSDQDAAGFPTVDPERGLAPYGAAGRYSRGRRFAEPAPAYRTEYQRDRDRVVHATAFRRLEYKTQVFVNHEGDHYRTRLTHSLEVAQIARTVARALGLNEDLVEAISLAHDLGHTPFGHAGQDALNACMADFGGFEHNLQSLRVVDQLENRYAKFSGLNLTFETREGILKHCSARNARELGELGRRFLERRQPGLEAQLANVADELAYNNHDVDDGLRAGLLDVAALSDVPFFAEQLVAVQRNHPGADQRSVIHEVVRRMIDTLVTDLVTASAARFKDRGLNHPDDARRLSEPLIGFSASGAKSQQALKAFLRHHLYQHPKVKAMTDQAQEVVVALFNALQADYRLLPAPHQARAETAHGEGGAAAGARIVADYVAGMTDRFALQAYEHLNLS
jgi:dGTPase